MEPTDGRGEAGVERMRRTLVAWVALAALGPAASPAILGPASLTAQEGPPPSAAAPPVRSAEPLPIHRAPTPPRLDGVVGDAEWAGATRLAMTQFWPSYGAPLTRASEVLVMYDDAFLYAAGRFADTEVRANSFYRDGWSGDDAFDVVLDPLNDDQTGLIFTTTPLGMQQDQEILNDGRNAAGLVPINRSWDTFWDAEAAMGPDGWSAEMRIPLSSLRYRIVDGDAVMGLIVGRTLARTNGLQVFPAIEPVHDNAYFKPSLAQDIVLRDVDRRPPLHVSPYVLTGASRTRERGTTVLDTDPVGEIGGDVKYGLTDRLTLDLTVNTDFAQVESDAVQVNLDRFNLFFPERRQFFQERSSVFEFVHGDEGRLFHSRRIGLSDDGAPLRILGGARVTGRTGGWDLGFLDMQVAGDGVVPGENDGVVRVRRTLADGASVVGGMATSRIRTDGTRNLGLGADALVRVGARDYLTLQLAQTEDSERSEGLVERSMARVYFQRATVDGLAFSLDGVYSGADYDPALGFEERDAFMSGKGEVRWAWRPEDGTFARHTTFVTTRLFARTADRSMQSALVRLRWTGQFRRGGLLNSALNFAWEDLAVPLRLGSDATVAAGRYFVPTWYTNFYAGNANRLSGELIVYLQRFFDGWSWTVDASPNWVVSRHLTLGASVVRQHVWFPDRDQSLDPDIYRLRVRTARDTHFSAEAFLQYSRASDRFSGNARLRYRFAEGRDLYLVYDHVRDAEERIGLEGLGLSDRRLLLKWVHTFR